MAGQISNIIVIYRYQSDYIKIYVGIRGATTLVDKAAYTLIGTYDLPSSGLQKLMEIGTIIGDKAYSLQYIADTSYYRGKML